MNVVCFFATLHTPVCLKKVDPACLDLSKILIVTEQGRVH